MDSGWRHVDSGSGPSPAGPGSRRDVSLYRILLLIKPSNCIPAQPTRIPTSIPEITDIEKIRVPNGLKEELVDHKDKVIKTRKSNSTCDC